MPGPETNEAIRRLARVVQAATSIGVVGHVNPDGDALGSMVALALGARAADKAAVASFAEPFVVPETLAALDTSVLVPPSEFPDDLDLAVAVDTSVRHRVGSLADRMESASTLGVIDHHLSDGVWGDATVIDASAASTTSLVYHLLRELEWPITQEIATALYIGLVTDTGRFQYSNTTPETHQIAADLIEAGVQPDVIGQKLYEEAPFGYYELVARVLGRAEFDEDRAVVWSVVTDEDLEACGLRAHEADALIDLVRLARGSEVACLLKVRDGVVKGSLRSRGKVDVAEIAGVFGGGGHRNAAGFTSEHSVEDTIGKVLSEISDG